MEIPKKTERRSSVALVLLFIALAGCFVIAGSLYYRNYKKEYRVEVEKQLSAIAELKVGGLVQWRKERMGDANIFFKNAAFSDLARRVFENPGDMEARGKILAWLEKVQYYNQYDRVFLLDSQGVAKISFPDNIEPVCPYIKQNIADIMESGQISFLDFHRDAPDKPINLSITVPILDEWGDDIPIGLLVLRIDPEKYLYPFIAQWPTPSESAETLLVRRDGNDVLYLNELRFMKDTALTLRIPLEKIEVPTVKVALGQEGVVDGKDYRGEAVIAAMRAVPGSPWFLVARMDTEEVYAPVRERLRMVMAFIAALLISAGALFALIWRRQSTQFFRERYEAAEALRNKTEELDQFFNLSLDLLCIIDMNATFMRLNPAWHSTLGYSIEDMTGRKFLDFIHPDDIEASLAEMAKLSEQNPVLNFVNRYRHKDGSYRWFEWRAAPFGNIIYAAARDITEQMAAKVELEKHRDNLEKLVDERTAQTKILNRELSIRNKIAEIFLTVPDEEMYEKVLALILDSINSKFGVFGFIDDQGALVVPTMTRTIWDQCQVPDKNIIFPRDTWGDSIWPTAIRQKKLLYSNEPSSRIPKGHVPVIRNITAPIIYKDEVVGLLQIANKETDYDETDIRLTQVIADTIAPVLKSRLQRDKREEERRLAEQKLKLTLIDLERSNTELQQFAYVASHDLQEPLRMVASYTQLLAKRYKDKLDQDANEFIAFAVDGANRMQELINDLLNFSRVGTRGKPFEPTDCEEMLKYAIENLAVSIEESGAKITHDPFPTVKADGTQMVQLFQNLIANAIKFRSEDSPSVHISCSKNETEWVFSVKDNGIGIDPQYFDRIFIVFQRLHAKEDYPGTGIGLALAKKIVERHGGNIWVESQSNAGSTFYFTIPMITRQGA